MIHDFLVVRILQECRAGHKDATPRLPRGEAEALIGAGLAVINPHQGTSCVRCGGYCIGALRSMGWKGPVCWDCFQKKGDLMVERMPPKTAAMVDEMPGAFEHGHE